MKLSYANYLLKKTEQDYNRIATLFSNKRSYITPDVKDLGKYVKRGDAVLDFGCGNGRLYEVLKDIGVKYLGVDNSKELINIAKNKYPDASFKKIDFQDFKVKEKFDAIYMLAVLHHIPGEHYRNVLLSKLHELLKPNGTLVLTVWALESKKDIRKKLIVNKFLRIFGLNKMDFGDILFPFRDINQEIVADRYLHIFSQKELIRLLEINKFHVLKSEKNQRGRKVINQNHIIVAKKLPD